MLVGYNLRFDLGMIDAEFSRMNAPPLDLSGGLQIDPLRLWKQCEPRTLRDAHSRFAGGEVDKAHSAAGDTAATARLMMVGEAG